MSSPEPPDRRRRPSTFVVVAIIVAILLPFGCLGAVGLIFFICATAMK